MAKTNIPIAPQALTDSGWTFKEWCRCKIVRKAIYVNSAFPDLTVWLWVKSYQFQIKRKNAIIVSLTKKTKMEEVLKALTNDN